MRIMEPEQVIAIARDRTRLNDYGQTTQIDEAVDLLCSIDAENYRFNTWGLERYMESIISLMCRRINTISKFRTTSENVEVVSPIIVVGLPRTGTTYMHNLLSKDPNSMFVKHWEVVNWKASEALYDRCPDLKAMHYVGKHGPEECMHIMKLGFVEPTLFASIGGLKEYVDWCMTQDVSHSYELHRDYLRMLQGTRDKSHWVLKSPSHMMYLDHLISEYPDARIVYMHRPYTQVRDSSIKLMKALRIASLEANDMQTQIDTMELLRLMETRAYDSGILSHNTVNINYFDFIDRPMDTIKYIYNHFGMRPSAAYKKRLRYHTEQNNET